MGVPTDNRESPSGDQLTATWVELSIRIGVLALLLYWTFTLVRPFVTIAIWSAVLTVALYPVYDWMVGQLGGRRRLAAVLLTFLSLLIVIGPTTWLVLGLVDGVQTMSERLDPSAPDTAAAARCNQKLAAGRRIDLPVLGSRFEEPREQRWGWSFRN